MVFGDISVFLFRDFWQKFPTRFYNLGICEQAIVSVSAGLRSQGLIPFAHSINPFITERCFEQIKLDLIYNDFPINLVSCGASFDYAWDGPTHQTTGELAMLRNLPQIEVMQPGSPEELDCLLTSQYANERTSYFRLSDHSHGYSFPVSFGKGVVLQDLSAHHTVVTAGPLLKTVGPACAGLPVNLVYFHTLKPIDRALLRRFQHSHFIVVQDCHGLAESLLDLGGIRLTRIGPPEEFTLTYGTIEKIRQHVGLDTAGIRCQLEAVLNDHSQEP